MINKDIPREYRIWPCPDPATCPGRKVSGHSNTYCPHAKVVLDKRKLRASITKVEVVILSGEAFKALLPHSAATLAARSTA